MLSLGRQEYLRYEVPRWLNVRRANEIYNEMIALAEEKKRKYNVVRAGDEMNLYISFRVSDIVFFKYGIEDEHIKKVLSQQSQD